MALLALRAQPLRAGGVAGAACLRGGGAARGFHGAGVGHAQYITKTFAGAVAPASVVGVIGLIGLAVAALVQSIPVGWVGVVGLGVVLLMLALTMACAYAYGPK